MKRTISLTMSLFAAFLLCGLVTIQTSAAPQLRANGKIAFVSDRDGNAEIYLMNADGSGQTRLTNNSVRDDYPTWSPDGRTIAFVRQNSGTYSINLMNADGTNVRQIPTLNTTSVRSLSWSPDGAKIAFGYQSNIYTVNIDGSNRVNLTNDGQNFYYDPSWSPDGTRISFICGESPSYGTNVCSMKTDGSDLKLLTSYLHGFDNGGSPDYSPDGGQVAFNVYLDDYAYYGIALINSDGTNPQSISTGDRCFSPKWSPDGTKFVFSKAGDPENIVQIWTINKDASGMTQLTNTSTNNFSPDWQPLVINISDIDELYMAVNNSANAGSQIVIAPGVYMLSVNDSNGTARPNGGRLELQENMSLTGVVGDRSAVVIDAANLPLSSFNSAPPIPLTGAIRMGRGTNAIEWLTARNAVNGNANIGTDLASTTTNVRVAHVASTNSARGLDVRNFGAAMAGRTINAEIIDNDFYNNRIGAQGEGFRIASQQGANGGIINATLNGNRSYTNYAGLLLENNRSNNAVSTVFSTGDRFYENGLGALVGAALSSNSTVANGNNVSFTAHGDSFINNNGFNNFDFGGLVVLGTENISIPNGTSNNKLTVNLFGCQFSNNQLADLYAVGARSNPSSIGTPGTNNIVRVALHGIGTLTEFRADSIPATPGSGNSLTVSRQPIGKPDDYDGDGRDDLAVFRPSNSTWYIQPSSVGNFYGVPFGLSTDKLVPADYDGDGKTDLAVYRNGTWYLLRSQAGFTQVQFGLASDIPVPADFDGDGRAELAIYRGGTWWSFNLTNNQVNVIQFGLSTDKPVVADYDGDGKADQAVYRGNGEWHLNRSSQGYTVIQFGLSTDKPVPADYDGDGKPDVAVFRPSERNWYVLNSSTGNVQVVNWGLANDALVPADYDGDGKADIAIFRIDGTWWINGTTAGVTVQHFGTSDDIPTPNAFVN